MSPPNLQPALAFEREGSYVPAAQAAYRRAQEELANSVTHGLGLALSLIGLCFMLLMAAQRGTVWHVVGCGIYGLSLVLLYGVSTLYHTLRVGPSKRVLQVLDHICIYLLIAGTYTPFTLILLPTGWGRTLLILVWSTAIAGMIIKIHSFSIRCWPYLLTGWCAVVAAKPILENISAGLMLWLMAGGVFYMLGIIFFTRDHKRFFHALWHVFVLAGSICHYCAVMFYVLPHGV